MPENKQKNKVVSGVKKSEVNITKRRIFEGTLKALSNRGGTLLSMTDVVAASGVSRATLYRYFPSKDVLLVAFSEYCSDQFCDGVARAAEGKTTPQEIISSVLAFTTQFTLDMQSDRIMAVESQWAIDSLKAWLPKNSAALNAALEPVYKALESASGVQLNREFIGETIVRVQESASILPGDVYLSLLKDFAPKIVDFVLLHSVADS